MDKKKKPITPEIPYRRITEIQTTRTNPDDEKEYAKKHPESIYGGPTATDVLGSYTGKPADKYDKPVQDADDL